MAGLNRLGYGDRVTEAIPHDHCIPAPGQGIIAIEARAETADDEVWRGIDDRCASVCFRAERAVVEALGGGCQLPLGAIATVDGDALLMQAIVTSPDGSRSIRRQGEGRASDPVELGRRIAAALSAAGAIDILNSLR